MDKPSTQPQHRDPRTALQGKRVLITRAREQAANFERQLQTLGAVPLAFPTIRIAPPSDNYAALDTALGQLPMFDWAVFTSVNSVIHVWRRLEVLRLESSAFAPLQLAAIGPTTADALRANHLDVAVMPERHVAEALLDAIPNPAGQRFFLPCANLARDTLRTGLQAAGAEVIAVAAYHTVRAEPSPESLTALDAGVDFLTFTSSSTVRNFIAQVGTERAQRLMQQAMVVTIGPRTTTTARELGLRVDVTATDYTIDGLVDAMVSACHAA